MTNNSSTQLIIDTEHLNCGKQMLVTEKVFSHLVCLAHTIHRYFPLAIQSFLTQRATCCSSLGLINVLGIQTNALSHSSFLPSECSSPLNQIKPCMKHMRLFINMTQFDDPFHHNNKVTWPKVFHWVFVHTSTSHQGSSKRWTYTNVHAFSFIWIWSNQGNP